MLTPTYLFNENELRSFLEDRKAKLFQEIESQDVNYILNVSITDFCNHLNEKYKLEMPVLDEKNIVVDQQEKDIGHPITMHRVKGTRITYFIPFAGDSNLFRFKPSTFTYNPPKGIVKETELCIIFDGFEQNSERVKQDFDDKLIEIKNWLGWVSKQITQFNEALVRDIELEIKYRREKLLNDRKLVADLGFPLKKREDISSTYVVPEFRRKIAPKPTASTEAFKPEPAINMEDYNHILDVVNNMALIMERSPRSFKTMNEEDIRQHILVHLNGHYHGQATGETFNFQGKTDILVRHEEKNIFVAECKFWKGAEGLIDTINQILKYVSWRDTKTAIFIFNRNKNLSSVLSQIPEIVQRHPNFKRKLEYSSETGFRFVLHHKDDKNRELFLTIIVFEVPNESN